MVTLRRSAAVLAVILQGVVLGLSGTSASAGPAPDEPELELNPTAECAVGDNIQCVYHVSLEKAWGGGDVPDLDGDVLLTASSSLGSAECTSDDGALSCAYTTGDDLHVPFGETYSVDERLPDGWVISDGVGAGFTGIVGIDDAALPGELAYDVAEDRYCQSNPEADPPFDLEKFCTHTVVNELPETATTTATTTTTTAPEHEAPIELVADSLCVGDFPYVDYDVSGNGLTSDTVLLEFLFDGDVIEEHRDQPLSGRLLFPGASENPDDWPGWIEVANSNGEQWTIDTQSGEAEWRTGVILRANANPTAEVEVSYPDGESCATPRNVGGAAPEQTTPTTLPTPTIPPGAGLPETGSSETGTISWLALAFLGGGALLIGVARRRTIN